MTWLKVDDGALTHPKTMHLRSLADPTATAEAVIGFVMLAASWSGQHNTDCFIAESAGMFASPAHWQHLAAYAVKVGIISRATTAERRPHGGQRGWMVKIGKGEIFHLLLKEQIEVNREKRNFGRRLAPKIEALLRDGDQCRYCAQTVSEYDRKGGRGRTWDHPDPAVPDVIVVACRSCNSTKGKRTVAEWLDDGGLDLLLPPAERGEPVYLEQTTHDWLSTKGALPEEMQSHARAGTQPDAAARHAAVAARAQGASESDLRSEDTGVTDQIRPGRDGPGSGSGQVGLSASGGPPRNRTRSRPRGSRGSGARRLANPPDAA